MGRPRRARTPALGVLALTTVLALTGCLSGCSGGGDDDHSDQPSSGASRASGTAAPARDVTTVAYVGGQQLGEGRRQQMKKDVSEVIDAWTDHAYLGSFPRDDYSKAFAGFTPQAAALAMKQLDLMSNAGISDQITKATLTNRRVRLTVFAPRGLARGVTARVVLDFTTTGDLKADQRVLATLNLVKPKGATWQVFGFRVDQAVTR